MSISSEVQTLIDQWNAFDTDPETLKEVQDLVSSNNEQELIKIMSKRIDFGTAGKFHIRLLYHVIK